MKTVYLDHNASTVPDPRVVSAMLQQMTLHPGNPSSLHWAGQDAKRDFDQARTSLSVLLDCRTDELVMTSGATESNNAIIRGVVRNALEQGRISSEIHLVTSQIEHKSVLNTCVDLQRMGVQVSYVAADKDGRVSLASIQEACTSQTVLISLMLANNDTGVLQPIFEICAWAKSRGIFVHSDMVQAVGKIATHPRKIGLDFASLSAHKFGGPKGVGAIFQRNGHELPPLLTGGKQELARRAGTENLPGIVGMGVAAQIVAEGFAERMERITSLRNHLQNGIREIFSDVQFLGEKVERTPNTLLVRFLQKEGLAIVLQLDLEGIAVSVGSACGAGDQEPSHVLLGMGYSPKEALEGVRFSLGSNTTQEDIDLTLDALRRIKDYT